MSNDVQQVEVSIEQAKEMIELDNALQRLAKNEDFKKIILKGYVEEEAVRLVHLLGDPNLPTNRREDVMSDIKAIGAFNYYLGLIASRGDYFRGELEVHEETLRELHEEGNV